MKMKKLIKNAYDFGVIKLIAKFFHEILYNSINPIRVPPSLPKVQIRLVIIFMQARKEAN